jgi:hypothetical protein
VNGRSSARHSPQNKGLLIAGAKMNKDIGHSETSDLDGMKIRYHYASGVSYDHDYQDGKISWAGVAGPHEGYSQTEKYVAFEVAQKIYFLTWYERETRPSTASENQKDGYNVAIVLDLNRMVATASYNEPLEDGGQKWILDKARLDIL